MREGSFRLVIHYRPCEDRRPPPDSMTPCGSLTYLPGSGMACGCWLELRISCARGDPRARRPPSRTQPPLDPQARTAPTVPVLTVLNGDARTMLMKGPIMVEELQDEPQV